MADIAVIRAQGVRANTALDALAVSQDNIQQDINTLLANQTQPGALNLADSDEAQAIVTQVADRAEAASVREADIAAIVP